MRDRRLTFNLDGKSKMPNTDNYKRLGSPWARNGRGKEIARLVLLAGLSLPAVCMAKSSDPKPPPSLGQEVSVPHHLQDDEEFAVPLKKLLEHGRLLFDANWTEQEGGGRPLTKGNGKALSDPAHPLVGERSFNRLSAPDANSCTGCHNRPYGISGGAGDFAANVFVLGQRFDFLDFDRSDELPTKGSMDEDKKPVTLQNAANMRVSPGMFGAGYLEMLARQMTAELQEIRDSLALGETKALIAKGVSFGRLTRNKDGSWNTTAVEGLPRASVIAPTPLDRPNLILRPWHQASNVVSLREFANTAFNQHHGIQSTERFGVDTDPDGDGFVNELTRADVTAISLFQAAMAVPGRVIPNDPAIEEAVLNGERVFDRIGCSSCHTPALPLTRKGWIYSEPNPYNPPSNLRPGTAKTVEMDLTSPDLPVPRLTFDLKQQDTVWVPAYTDMRLHDISDPSESPEPLDMNQTPWTKKFQQGNRQFLTKRLWGCANEPPFFHQGLFTTLRQAVLAHSGEAKQSRSLFQESKKYDQDSLIEFLKTLQVLPPGTPALIVDEGFHPKQWPPLTASK
jgi:cytochrome c peroxidase